ncbi:hypothetical protein [Parafrankia discariae]|uniref:hypothetical protein n=1 Tax=Parafrankia discariae TaxID=365528 RepID=UPI000369DB56|nr:hypothetical protein [Parafrankia discariae]
MIAVLAVLVVCVVAAAAIARADPFDPTSGTVAVMASGGTVYEDYTAGPQSVNGSVTVAAVTLPAGRYELLAKAWVDNSLGSESFIQCGFVDGIAGNDNTRASAGSAYVTMIASGASEFAEETEVEYVCASDAAVDVHRALLKATTVSAIVLQ